MEDELYLVQNMPSESDVEDEVIVDQTPEAQINEVQDAD